MMLMTNEFMSATIILSGEYFIDPDDKLFRVNVKYNEGEHVLFYLNRTHILPNLLRKNTLPISEF